MDLSLIELSYIKKNITDDFIAPASTCDINIDFMCDIIEHIVQS